MYGCGQLFQQSVISWKIVQPCSTFFGAELIQLQLLVVFTLYSHFYTLSSIIFHRLIFSTELLLPSLNYVLLKHKTII